jgi:hypothetical protein
MSLLRPSATLPQFPGGCRTRASGWSGETRESQVNCLDRQRFSQMSRSDARCSGITRIPAHLSQSIKRRVVAAQERPLAMVFPHRCLQSRLSCRATPVSGSRLRCHRLWRPLSSRHWRDDDPGSIRGADVAGGRPDDMRKGVDGLALAQPARGCEQCPTDTVPWHGSLLPDLDSRTGFRHREWQKCWRLIKPDQKCGAKL